MVDYYYVGFFFEEWDVVQEVFINDNILVICVMVAFGMGIDKLNVCWVIYYNLFKNIESYYQEIGWAGCDGVKLDIVFFYSYNDVVLMEDIFR